MKKYLTAAAFIIALLLMGNNFFRIQKERTALPSHPIIQNKQSFSVNEPAQLTLATINIYGFDCPTCPIGAEYALKDLKGVYDAKVTSSGELSRVLYDTNAVTVEDFRKTLDPFTLEVISKEPTYTSKLN